MIPMLMQIVTWLTNMLVIVTQIVAALFGFKSTVGNIMTTAASNAKKAAKEARGALAAFDQINVLQKEESPATGAETGPTVTPPPITIPQELLDKVEEFKQKFMESLKFVIELWEKLKAIVIETWEKIDTWIKNNPEKFKLFLIILGLIVLAFIAIAAAVWLITAAMGVATAVSATFAAVMAIVASPILLIVLLIGLLIGAIVLLILMWPTLSKAAVDGWARIKEMWGPAKDYFQTNVIDPIKERFFAALDAIKEKLGQFSLVSKISFVTRSTELLNTSMV